MSAASFSAPSTESMDSILPSFEFTDLVSSNARSAVYFANQRSLERRVAIKLFAPGFLPSFESSARAGAGLKHKNIIGVLDSGIVDGMPYIVMEFVPGKSLAHSTKGNAVEFGQAMILIDGICEGVAHAHAKGIVHGSLNHSDILLNQDAEPKIGNFGMPYSADTGAAPDHFAAPEVVLNPASATKRSDVHSAAAIFYRLITGSPHGPDAAPPSSLCTTCRPEVDAVWKQATDPDPAKRMDDVRAFHTALKEAVSGRKTNTPSPAQAGKSAGKPAVAGKSKVRSMGGIDLKLVRNVAIIIALLYGVSLAWENLKLAREKREKENLQILAKQEAAKQKAITDAAEERARELAEKAVKTGTTEPDPNFQATESPMDSLERLRSALVSGKRTEMPVGSIQKGDGDYFLVTERMSWPDASQFAEDHGGHLVVPGAEADASWLLSEVAKGRSAWIGIARGGQDSWTTVTGGIWDAPKEPAGNGRHLSIEENGISATDGDIATRPFIIQWHRDGSNPGKLASQLATTARSLSEPVKIFPPGTASFGNRRFLHVRRSMNWEDASKLAEDAGGNLMVVSNPEEAANLKSMTAKLDSGKRIWLGGLLEGSLWKWSTGEPWVSGDWAADADATDENSALCIRPGSGWDGMDRGEEASGFIIEWSEDPKASAAESINPGEGMAALIAKAKEVVVAADRERDEALASNTEKIGWDLKPYIRGLNRSDQLRWEPEVERLKQCTEGNRFVPGQIQIQGITLSPEMAKVAGYAARKQGEIDAKFTKTTETIRSAFVKKLSEIIQTAKDAGQIKVAKDAAEVLDQASVLDDWLESFGVHPSPAALAE